MGPSRSGDSGKGGLSQDLKEEQELAGRGGQEEHPRQNAKTRSWRRRCSFREWCGVPLVDREGTGSSGGAEETGSAQGFEALLRVLCFILKTMENFERT